jgi:SprT protein
MTTDQILNEIENAFLIAENYYQRTFKRPKVTFKRNGSTAGWARRDCSELMFQLDLAESNSTDFVSTIKHEVAHIIQFHLHPRSQAHGNEWKYIMRRVFGLNPDRCHNYDTSVTKVKKQTVHIYTCPCQKEFKISTTMHNRIQKALIESKTRKYYDANLQPYYRKPTYSKICTRCRGTIVLKQEGNPYEQKLQNLLQQLQAKSVA